MFRFVRRDKRRKNWLGRCYSSWLFLFYQELNVLICSFCQKGLIISILLTSSLDFRSTILEKGIQFWLFLFSPVILLLYVIQKRLCLFAKRSKNSLFFWGFEEKCPCALLRLVKTWTKWKVILVFHFCLSWPFGGWQVSIDVFPRFWQFLNVY